MTPRVLIVEDEAVTALDLATELRGLGYEVCGIVDSADEAVVVAAREGPQVVLMDVRLAAGGDGIEAARRVGDRQDAAIIFLTAHSDEATLARALEVSPAGYLIKPFRARELKVAIDVAIAKHASEASVRKMAMADPLTGLPNRRRMDELLKAEWARCVRDGRPGCLLAIDVDFFKPFNDTYGHPAGDRCLMAVASALHRCGRPGDTVCRWGGEEFLAVLPGADLAAATRIAEAMVQAVRALGIPHRSSAVAPVVTISVGVADLPPTRASSVATLVARVDAALYAAKHAGRNRCATADAPPSDVRMTMIGHQFTGLHSPASRAVPTADQLVGLVYEPATDLLHPLDARGPAESMAGGGRIRLADSPLLLRLIHDRRGRVIDDLSQGMHEGLGPLVDVLVASCRCIYATPLFDGLEPSGFLVLASRAPAAFGPETGARLAAVVKLAALLLCRESVGPSAPGETADEKAILHRSEHVAHLSRMAEYSRLIARRLADSHELTDEFVERVFLFAPLHDVGKAGISADILLKPGRLSPRERTVMASHVTIGMQVVEALVARFDLGDLAGIEVLRNIVAGHHEKLDGSGYPRGLVGEAIPLESRIVAVADIFDALTSHRAYKEAWSIESALAALEALAGDGKLDPSCVQAIRASHDECLGVMARFREG